MSFTRRLWVRLRRQPWRWSLIGVGAVVVLYAVGGVWINLPLDPFHDHSAASDRSVGRPDSSSVSRPPLPASAQRNSVDGATAFAAYLIDVNNYVARTQDTEPWKDAFGAICNQCQGIIKDFEDAKSRGHYLRGGIYTVKNVIAEPLSESRYIARVTYDITSQQEYDRSGTPVRPDPAPAATGAVGGFDLAWQDGKFQVLRLAQLDR